VEGGGAKHQRHRAVRFGFLPVHQRIEARGRNANLRGRLKADSDTATPITHRDDRAAARVSGADLNRSTCDGRALRIQDLQMEIRSRRRATS
jgi:hypothetical protein